MIRTINENTRTEAHNDDRDHDREERKITWNTQRAQREKRYARMNENKEKKTERETAKG